MSKVSPSRHRPFQKVDRGKTTETIHPYNSLRKINPTTIGKDNTTLQNKGTPPPQKTLVINNTQQYLKIRQSGGWGVVINSYSGKILG